MMVFNVVMGSFQLIPTLSSDCLELMHNKNGLEEREEEENNLKAGHSRLREK
jgi:hypothetical protein